MDYKHLIIPAIFLLIIVVLIIILHIKKKTAIRKVNSLNTSEKTDIINGLAKPLGYMYDSHQDIFISRLDATQKIFGYI